MGTDANTNEKDLWTYNLPAGSLNADQKGVRITAWGTTAANNNSKTLKVYFGGTVVVTMTAQPYNDSKWRARAEVVRTGAAAGQSPGNPPQE